MNVEILLTGLEGLPPPVFRGLTSIHTDDGVLTLFRHGELVQIYAPGVWRWVTALGDDE